MSNLADRVAPFLLRHGRDDLAEELRKAIAAVEAQVPVGWQPIETAPKYRLVIVTDGMIVWTDRMWDDLSGWVYRHGIEDPIYWMPLPAPPAAIDRARGGGE